MFSKYKIKQLIFIVLFVSFGYLAYRYFLKDFYWNNQSHTIKVENVALHEVFELTKHDLQGPINALEIELKGKASENITFYIGESPQTIHQVISIKKGNVDYKASFDWSHDQSYIIFIGNPTNKGNLRLEYRFISSSF